MLGPLSFVCLTVWMRMVCGGGPWVYAYDREFRPGRFGTAHAAAHERGQAERRCTLALDSLCLRFWAFPKRLRAAVTEFDLFRLRRAQTHSDAILRCAPDRLYISVEIDNREVQEEDRWFVREGRLTFGRIPTLRNPSMRQWQWQWARWPPEESGVALGARKDIEPGQRSDRSQATKTLIRVLDTMLP